MRRSSSRSSLSCGGSCGCASCSLMRRPTFGDLDFEFPEFELGDYGGGGASGGGGENIITTGGPVGIGIGIAETLFPTDEEEACREAGGVWDGSACVGGLTGPILGEKLNELAAFCQENPDDPTCAAVTGEGEDEEAPPGDDDEEEKKKSKPGPVVGPVVGPVKPKDDKTNQITGNKIGRGLAAVSVGVVGAVAAAFGAAALQDERKANPWVTLGASVGGLVVGAGAGWAAFGALHPEKATKTA